MTYALVYTYDYIISQLPNKMYTLSNFIPTIFGKGVQFTKSLETDIIILVNGIG